MHLSLQNIVLPPPLPAIAGILLVLGLVGCGRLLVRLCAPGAGPLERLAGPYLALGLSGGLVQALALLGLAELNVVRALGGALCLAGAAELWHWGNRAPSLFSRLGSDLRELRDKPMAHCVALLALAVLALLALASLGPATNEDSLHYHLAVPLRTLETGHAALLPEWPDSRLAGLGEWINAIGLAIGSDSFGSILQMLGLVTVLMLIRNVAANRTTQLFASALVLSLLPLLPLVASAKPQLLPAAAIVLAVALVAGPARVDRAPPFVMGAALIGFAIANKYSFLLSGGVAAGLLVWRAFAVARLRLTLVALGAAFAILVAPLWLAHFLIFGDPLSPMLAPLIGAGLPGDTLFAAFLRSYRESDMPIGIGLFVPSSFSLGDFFGVFLYVPILGAAFLVLNRQWSRLVALAAVMFVCELALSQKNARFFLEPLFLICLAIARFDGGAPKPGWLAALVPQLATMLAASAFGAVSLFPGALTANLRNTVWSKSAPGYNAAQWLDSVLPRDAVLLTDMGNVAFMPRPVISMRFAQWLDPGDAAGFAYYKAIVRKAKPTVAVVFEGEVPPLLAACFGDRLSGPQQLIEGHRNPFNRMSFTIEVYAVDFENC